MEFIVEHKLQVINTQYRKQEHKLFTNVRPGVGKLDSDFQHGTHYQVDYGLIETTSLPPEIEI